MATGPKKITRKVLVKELNPFLTCSLCGGYFIDATALVDCLHIFCRGCILRYFENSKQACPTCNTVYKKKNSSCFRPDHQLQTMVYKIVPGLYFKEMQRREDFYRSTGVRASSSCSDDSVLGDMMQDHEEWVSTYAGDQKQFLSPDDAISLSLEYYQRCLDDTPDPALEKTTGSTCPTAIDKHKRNGQLPANEVEGKDALNHDVDREKRAMDALSGDRRYLQCPAAFSMSLLQKFVRMKYGLTADHRVDIIYCGEVLPSDFSLMDVAYTFKWCKTKPMRFFYRIFTPLKVQPIRIVNTASSNGGKQLQIVPVKPNPEHPKQEEPPRTILENNDMESQNYKNKEKLLANLQLQSKAKSLEKEKQKKIEQPEPEPCVYEYEEPDKEEIKRFAEKRDREWALQKHLDEQEESRHVSKKRKKSKHSKNESVHKKRKLHAAISSAELIMEERPRESLKLKVKLTSPNGHKHKHHKSSQNQIPEVTKSSSEMSSKEKLLQMRAVRHKHISNDEKSVQTVPVQKPVVERPKEPIIKFEQKNEIKKAQTETPKEVKKPEDKPKTPVPNDLPKTQVPESTTVKSPTKSPEGLISGKTLRSDFSIKTSASKELALSQPSPEKSEHSEKQAQKTFLKTFQSHAETYNRPMQEKIVANKVEGGQAPKMTTKIPPVILNNKLHQQQQQQHKSLERKIANLKQQCTIEAKKSPSPNDRVVHDIKNEKKVVIPNSKPQVLNSQYPAGFTVSKIEHGVKRKVDNCESGRDKRPSLEITLINPTPPVQTQPDKPPEMKVKRPPPATIPLDRIKKSMNFKSGVSIIPKRPDACDNVGALDLSKPHKPMLSEAQKKELQIKPTSNGLINKDAPKNLNLNNSLLKNVPKLQNPDNKNTHMSNLQMLSKVATEYPALNKTVPNQLQQNSKPKPQIPNLQTIKIPVPPGSPKPGGNPEKALPNLHEIPKGQFRLSNPQVRNMRPNQNQAIRSIINPSLFVKQQNQNRLNSLAQTSNSAEANKEPPKLSNGSAENKTAEEVKSEQPVVSANNPVSAASK